MLTLNLQASIRHSVLASSPKCSSKLPASYQKIRNAPEKYLGLLTLALLCSYACRSQTLSITSSKFRRTIIWNGMSRRSRRVTIQLNSGSISSSTRTFWTSSFWTGRATRSLSRVRTTSHESKLSGIGFSMRCSEDWTRFPILAMRKSQ